MSADVFGGQIERINQRFDVGEDLSDDEQVLDGDPNRGRVGRVPRLVSVEF